MLTFPDSVGSDGLVGRFVGCSVDRELTSRDSTYFGTDQKSRPKKITTFVFHVVAKLR